MVSEITHSAIDKKTSLTAIIFLYGVEFNPSGQVSLKVFDLPNKQSYIRFHKLTFKGKAIVDLIGKYRRLGSSITLGGAATY